MAATHAGRVLLCLAFALTLQHAAGAVQFCLKYRTTATTTCGPPVNCPSEFCRKTTSSCQFGFVSTKCECGCAQCDTSHWLKNENLCADPRVCQPGEYEVLTFSPTQPRDRLCALCGAGFYSQGENSPFCSPCEAGFSQPLEGKSSCDPCLSGTVQPDSGAAKCNACSPGSSQLLQQKLTCDPCSVGRYQNEFGKSVCKNCLAGSFQDKTSQTSCKECPPGSVSADNGANECDPCKLGESYQNERGKTTCDPVTVCDFNVQYITLEPSLSHDRQCTDLTVCTSNQFQVTAPTQYSDRICRNYDVNPSFSDPLYEFPVSESVATGDLVHSFSVDPTGMAVTYSSDLSSNAYLSVTTNGRLVVQRERTTADPETLLFNVIATEVLPRTRSNCVLKPPTGEEVVIPPEGSGGCTSSTLVRVIATGFRDCPAGINYIVVDGSSGGVAVTWDPPTLSNEAQQYESSVVASHEPGDTFPLGITAVTYDLNVDGVSFQCSFEVTVSVGLAHAVPSVTTHLLSLDSASFISNFLVDDADTAGVTARLAPFDGNVRDRGFILELSPANEGEKIAITIPSGAAIVRLEVFLAFCVTETFVDTNAVEATTAIKFATINPLDVTWTDTGSKVYNNGECFTVSGQTSSMPASQMDFIRVSLSGISATPNDATGVKSYRSVPGLPNVVRFVAETSTAVTTAQQFVTVDDVFAPQFVDCPQTITIAAAQGATGATVTWDEPTAFDNVAVSAVTSTHSPGDFFSIAGSPHEVSYVAVDTAGLSETCKFTVHVTWTPTVVTLETRTVPRGVTSTVTSTPLGQFVHRTHLLTSTTLGSQAITSATATALRLPIVTDKGDLITIRLPRNGATRIVIDATLFSGTRPDFVATDGTDFTELFFTGLRDPAGNLLTFDDAWFKSSPNSVLQLSPPFVRVSGSTVVLQDVFPFEYVTFEGLVVQISSPAGSGAAERRSRRVDVVLDPTPGSGISVDSSFLQLPGSVFDNSTVAEAVTVADVFAPVFVNCPTPLGSAPVNLTSSTANDSATVAMAWEVPVAEDNRDGFVTGVAAPGLLSPGSQFPIGTSTMVYTATDASGNEALCQFNVVVTDPHLPSMTCTSSTLEFDTAPLVAYANVNDTVLVNQANVTATDNSGVVIIESLSTGVFDLNTTFVTLRARDLSGNEDVCNISLQILDREKPVVVCPDNKIVSTTSDFAAVFFEDPIASDNDLVVSVVASKQSNAEFPVGTTPVTVTATDRSGNTNQCAFEVQVVSSAATAASSGVNSVVIYAVVAAVVAVLLVAAVVMRRRLRKKPESFERILHLLNTTVDTAGGGPKRPREINRSNVKLLGDLGKGNFGAVQRALLDERIMGMPSYLVAVKLLKDGLSGDRHALLEEAAVMAQFDHPHCVGLIGVVTIGEPLMVCIEYCEFGSLNSYLTKTEVPEQDKLLIARDCADGLGYLAQRGFIHRDVAARNVLISSEKRGKISDFGLSRDADDDAYYHSRGGALPVRWSAPEALNDRKFSQKTDVWAYGVLLYELWTKAETPYQGWNNQKVWVEVEHGYRLPQPDGCKADVYAIMRSCWDASPAKRPTFAELLSRIEDLHGVTLMTVDAPEVAQRTPEPQRAAADNPYLALLGENGSEIGAADYLAEAPELFKKGGAAEKAAQAQAEAEQHAAMHLTAGTKPNPYVDEVSAANGGFGFAKARYEQATAAEAVPQYDFGFSSAQAAGGPAMPQYDLGASVAAASLADVPYDLGHSAAHNTPDAGRFLYVDPDEPQEGRGDQYIETQPNEDFEEPPQTETRFGFDNDSIAEDRESTLVPVRSKRGLGNILRKFAESNQPRP